MDLDVLPIRDIAPLRNSGFANIIGHEHDNLLNNGIMLAKKNSALMAIFAREQNVEYTGSWIKHGGKLLTKLASKLMIIPGEVLMMDRRAFTPIAWNVKSGDSLFGQHPESVPRNITKIGDAEEVWAEKNVRERWEWTSRRAI